jgi:hypothetical protein
VEYEALPSQSLAQIKLKRSPCAFEQWQCDASYFFVVGWASLDDYSRMILAWELKTDMTSLIDSAVLEQAVEWTGMKNVPVEDRSRLVGDNGPGNCPER